MAHQMEPHLQTVVRAGDTISALAVLTTLAGFLPPIAALSAMLWYCVQIYESKTVQAWLQARKQKATRKSPRVSGEVDENLR